MALNLQDKQIIIKKISEIAKNAMSAIIANSCGLTVNKINELRKLGRASGIYMCVIRNTLIRRIVKDTQFECLKNIFIGPTLIAFSNKHPGTAARLFKAFAKDNINFKIKVAAFDGKVLLDNQINSLADLPTHEEAISYFISTIKEISSIKLIRVLSLLNDKKI